MDHMKEALVESDTHATGRLPLSELYSMTLDDVACVMAVRFMKLQLGDASRGSFELRAGDIEPCGCQIH